MSALKTIAQHPIIAAAGFEDDPDTFPRGSADTGRCVIYPLSAPGGMVDVEPCLGDIDVGVDLVRDISCSCSAGSAPTAPINCSG